MVSPDVMVVSHSLEAQQAFASTLGQLGLAPIIATTASEAEAILKRHAISLVFCSDELRGGGVENLIRHSSQPPNQVPVVVFSRLDDCQRYLNFLQAGAFDYVLYPPNGDEIERVVRTVLYSRQPEIAKQVASVA
jgi:DNA-binding NtrC family response regulator